MEIDDFIVDDKLLNEIIQTEIVFRNHSDIESLAKQFENEFITFQSGIFKFLPIISAKSSFQDLYRISINKYIREDKLNERLYNLSELKYPPQEKAKNLNYNRCSFKGQSIFYGGFGQLFALIETKPEKGDLITISKWKINDGEELQYVPIFQNEKIQELTKICSSEWNEYTSYLDKLSSLKRTAIERMYSLITFFFMRPVYKKIEYLFSAHLANAFFNQTEHEEIEAIFYPSVPTKFMTWNLAIKPDVFDKKFRFVEAKEHLVTVDKDSGGGWGSYVIAESNNYSDDKLNWIEQISSPELNNLKKEYGIM